jgi:hypothetical protein
MPLRAMKKSCQCCQFPCTSDAYFAESNIPAIITTEYEDQCGCRIFCSYPNNVYTILLAQVLTLVSFVFILDAASDCDFVRVPASAIDPFSTQYLLSINKTIPEEDLTKNATERGLGLFAWESLDGSCASGGKRDKPKNERFIDLVGTDWKAPQVMAIISAALSAIAVLWMMSFTCVATKRRYRAMLSFLLILVLPLFQSLTFLVLRTDFCEDNDCELAAHGHSIIVAIVTSAVAGILLCVGTTNFPGNPYTKGRRSQMCSNLLFCRHTCRQMVMDPHAEIPELNSVEMDATNNHADHVVEVPVESDFFDASLIHGSAIPDTPPPVEIPVASLAPSPMATDAALAVAAKTV